MKQMSKINKLSLPDGNSCKQTVDVFCLRKAESGIGLLVRQYRPTVGYPSDSLASCVIYVISRDSWGTQRSPGRV